MDAEKVYQMKFSRVYPLLVAKAERKGRTKAEVDAVLFWLTGYDEEGLARILAQEADYRTLFAEAPALNPKAEEIRGVVCGIRVEEIEDPLMRQIRQLDKLVDELAKGWSMEKIRREVPPRQRAPRTRAK